MRIKVFSLCITLLLLTLGLVPLSYAFSEQGVTVTGINTIAGYAALLTVEGPKNAEIEVLIEKPDQSLLTIPTTTDGSGWRSFDLYPYHTRKAGTYKLSGKIANGDNFGVINSFQVYPDEVSENHSVINLSNVSLMANGYDYALLNISLRDGYTNSISGHEIQVFSTRTEDQIEVTGDNLTDQQGSLSFKISSKIPGISYLIVRDNSANKTLSARPKIAFLDESAKFPSIGGDNNIVLLAQSNQPQLESSSTKMLKFSDVPSQVSIEQPISFTVQALTETQNIDQNYKSTIHFSSSDPNATLPEDFKFKESDKGTHTFSLSLKFLTAGTQKLTVNDLNNFEIKDEASIIVLGSNERPSSPQSSNLLQITAPKSGAYKSSQLVIEGNGPAFSELKVYDFNKEISKTTTNGEGFFSFESPKLPDGKHQFYVAILQGTTITQQSSMIDIQIDTTPPIIDSIEIKPQPELNPKQNFSINVFSEARLTKATAIFNKESHNMEKDKKNSSLYATSYLTPNENGTFPIDIILVDELGNSATYNNATNIMVAKDTFISQPALDLPNQDDEPETATISPSKVTGIEYDVGIDRVTFTFEPSIDDTFIQNYRIYYARNRDKLLSLEDEYEVVNTFDNSTTWYIPNLLPNTTYYFTLSAVDSQFNESEKSSIIEARTLASIGSTSEDETIEQNLNMGGEEIAKSEEEIMDKNENFTSPEKQPESGSAFLFLIFFSVFFSQIYFLIGRIRLK